MNNRKLWINLSLFNFLIVALLGMTLRSKILFALPFIDFNHLLDAHEHFAFSGWVTLILMTLMDFELLKEAASKRMFHQWLLAITFLSSWGMLVSYMVWSNGEASGFFSTVFISITYIFSFRFIMDVRKATLSKTVKLLSVFALVCLALSSGGPIMLSYLFASKSLNAVLYRDALFTYLHLTYNGFFTLSVMALLINKLEKKIDLEAKKNMLRFAQLLCLSVIPSLFLSYLWHYPNTFFHVMAIAGSVLLLLSFAWFVRSGFPLRNIYANLPFVIKYLSFFSINAFILKLVLQSFTIFPLVGDSVFGDRPIIIGFLHLVFLVFVSLFLLAYLCKTGDLDISHNFTRIAIAVFTTGVVANEAILMTQGLGAMFIKSSYLFPWLLWATSIILFTGILLIYIARITYRSKEAV